MFATALTATAKLFPLRAVPSNPTKKLAARSITSLLSSMLPAIPTPPPQFVFPPHMIPPVHVYKTPLPSSATHWSTPQPSDVEGVYPVRRIFCIGRNYASHVAEMGGSPTDDPFFFMKPGDSVVDTTIHDPKLPPCPKGGEGFEIRTIPYSSMTNNLHWEAELVLAIGPEVDVSDPLACIYGLSVACDLTRRDLQNKAKELRRPWDDSKGFDDSAILGGIFKLPPLPEKKAFLTELMASSSINLKINGDLKQSSPLNLMIWSLEEQILYLTKHHLLLPGDLVFTGTPSGVGALEVGDVVEIEVEGVGGCRFNVGPKRGE
jgi:fumarylpyruvate hydrolase